MIIYYTPKSCSIASIIALEWANATYESIELIPSQKNIKRLIQQELCQR